MSVDALPCPMCAGHAHRLGAVADGDFFAGRVLEQPIAGGHLWRCAVCHSMFKHPILSAADYAALYAQGRADQWSGSGRRRDFELAAAIIARESPCAAVLDVGCGAGELLRLLPPAHARYGIEPSTAAAALARGHGVQVLAADLSGLSESQRFDVVTLIDVIEHATDVPQLLHHAVAHLRPGGLLLVSSGDPQCTAWRGLFGARFWYASFPEHLRFPSRIFFQRWAAQNALQWVQCTPFRYQDIGAAGRFVGPCLQMAYAMSPAAFSAAGRVLRGGRQPGSPARRWYSPGVPGAFRDHQMIVLRTCG
jgi:2-polyprenyl-3-methyl-5-hydroxy-6-metoxy-1,4-benzoquinol methylase